MTERLTIPRDRDAILEDFAELTMYGVATEDAARRLGVTVDDITRWVKSRDNMARRRANRVTEGAKKPAISARIASGAEMVEHPDAEPTNTPESAKTTRSEHG